MRWRLRLFSGQVADSQADATLLAGLFQLNWSMLDVQTLGHLAFARCREGSRAAVRWSQRTHIEQVPWSEQPERTDGRRGDARS